MEKAGRDGKGWGPESRIAEQNSMEASVVEPKTLGILVWVQMGEALNVALAQMARRVSHLLRSGAEWRGRDS
jgi:hypothetical protein